MSVSITAAYLEVMCARSVGTCHSSGDCPSVAICVKPTHTGNRLDRASLPLESIAIFAYAYRPRGPMAEPSKLDPSWHAGTRPSGQVAIGHLPRSDGRYRLRFRDQELDIHTDDFVIGRSAECDIQLECGLVSRRHARLRHCEAGVVLEDLGSRNGVMINQRKVSEPVLLRHGDVVAIGIELLEFVDLDMLHRPESLSTIPPPVMATRVGDEDAPDAVTLASGTETLTDRERQVLELIALGHTQREVASRLCISAKTVETHRARIAEKLRCHSRADFVTRAIAAGFLRGK